jgi:hypothetical protein
MNYLRNGFYWIVLKYGIYFSNAFDFMRKSISCINKLPLWQICICNKCDLCISHMLSSTQINNPIISCGIGLSLHCCYIEHLFFIGVVAREHPNLLHIFVVYDTPLKCGYLYHNKNNFWKVDLNIFSHCKKRVLKMYPLLDN